MINLLKIQNFQSHKNSILKFVPGVNVIIGKSDSGKTAIIRALKWAIFNKPGGDAFCSHWGGETSVLIQTNSDSVKRLKAKSKNQYYLNKTEFKAFGASVPVEIEKSFNITDINLQSQFDSPFLLTSTSGDVAKHFNKLANLTKIDSSQAFIKSELGKLKSQFNTEFSNIEKYNENLLKYADLEKLEIEVKVLEEVKNDHLNLCKNVQKITSLQNQIEQTKADIKLLSPLLSLEKPVEAISSQFEELTELQSSKTTLEGLQSQIQAKNDLLKKWEGFITVECQVDDLLKLYQAVENIEKKRKTLSTLHQDIQENFKIIGFFKKDLLTLEKNFKVAMPNICPLCGQTIK